MPTITAYPTTDTAVTGTWTNPTNVQASDSSVAFVTLTSGTSAIREQGGYGFTASIPANAVITSVALEVATKLSNVTGTNVLGVRARLGGVDQTESTDSTEPTVLTPASFDITSLKTWTRADLLDANFATRISGTKSGSPATTEYDWDYVRVVVTYTTGVGIADVGAAAGVSGSSLSVPLPPTWLPGDVLICSVMGNASVPTFTITGWTLIDQNKTGDSTAFFYKVAAAGETAPTVSATASSAMGARIIAVRNADQVSPINAPVTPFAIQGGASTTATSNDFTPTRAGELILFSVTAGTNVGAQSASGWSGTNPALTEVYDSVPVNGAWLGLASGTKTDATATGARSATLSVSQVWVAALFGVRPTPSLAVSTRAARNSLLRR